MRGWVAIVFLAACYSPTPLAGSPCANGELCPTGLVCEPATQTCERGLLDANTVTDAPPTDDVVLDAPPDARLIDGCTPATEICGDGIDQNCDGSDSPCVANDRAAGALDVTVGGVFTTDVRLATDDLKPSCSGNGGHDVFFQVTLNAPQVYYFDTLDSNFDSVVRVTAGACTVAIAAELACQDDACNGDHNQVALALPAGTSCIMIDQKSSAVTTGDLQLRVVPGGRTGMALASGIGSTSGDTCTAANTDEPLDQNCDAPGSGGKDVGYFITACPNQTLSLDAATCSGTNYDSVLYVRRVGGPQVACNDDKCGNQASEITDVPIAGGLGGSLFWLIVDGFALSECGTYGLQTTLN